ncbi:MAG: DUF192 domain-containing protein [Candidatus Diapherotrites archaeon]|uniref:DUF192 domain-containing protein n=1 Tax=Candidatus Iainarchaeum sp. TaxID=3101447 RepID=A0A7K4BZY9_9ARCH|nr:DUF192 domain-containing protein [Candidatus Diapherotrites archaeon]
MLKVNGKPLIKKVKLANSPLERMRGLMFEDEKKFDYALVFTSPKEGKIESSLHMMFVFFPIAAIFLDSNKNVVDKTTLTPFTVNYTPKKPAKYVIEMPPKEAKKIKIKDKISW